MLLELQDRLASVGAGLVLASVSRCVRRVLTVTGLDARLLMAASVEGAVDVVAAEVAGAAERPGSVRTVRSLGACRAAPRPADTRG